MHSCAVHEGEPECIRTILVHKKHRVSEVALALGHLLTVLCKDYSVDDAVLERRLVEKGACHDCERIEPATRLVKAFADEVCRERAGESLLVLKRIVKLCVWHASALEPAVKYIRDPSHGSLSVWAGPCKLVHVVLVNVVNLLAALLFKLSY